MNNTDSIPTLTESIERWFPVPNEKKPKDFTYKSPTGVWFKTIDDYYRLLREAK